MSIVHLRALSDNSDMIVLDQAIEPLLTFANRGSNLYEAVENDYIFPSSQNGPRNLNLHIYLYKNQT